MRLLLVALKDVDILNIIDTVVLLEDIDIINTIDTAGILEDVYIFLILMVF